MCEALEHMVKAAWTKWSRESQKNNIEKNFVICSLFFPLQGSRLSHSCNHCFENHCELLFSILISYRLDRNKTQKIEKKNQNQPCQLKDFTIVFYFVLFPTLWPKKRNLVTLLPPYLQLSIFLTYSSLSLSGSKTLKLDREFSDRTKDSNMKVHTPQRNRGNINEMIPAKVLFQPVGGNMWINLCCWLPLKSLQNLEEKKIIFGIFVYLKESWEE